MFANLYIEILLLDKVYRSQETHGRYLYLLLSHVANELCFGTTFISIPFLIDIISQ